MGAGTNVADPSHGLICPEKEGSKAAWQGFVLRIGDLLRTVTI
jgi:hypothetical protein